MRAPVNTCAIWLPVRFRPERKRPNQLPRSESAGGIAGGCTACPAMGAEFESCVAGGFFFLKKLNMRAGVSKMGE